MKKNQIKKTKNKDSKSSSDDKWVLPDVSIIIPAYNAEKTIKEVIDSVLDQTYGGEIEIIVIDDDSTDDTPKILRNYEHLQNFRVIQKKDRGLAKSYNVGIKASKFDIIVTLHADCILTTKNSLSQLIEPFKAEDVAVVCPITSLPKDCWDKYGFWGKLMFARSVGRARARYSRNLTGKFDAFRKDVLVRMGLFDEKSFRVAGEDGDLHIKLVSSGIGRIVWSDSRVNHLHCLNRFGLKDLLMKEVQFGEVHGVLRRRYLFHRFGLWHLLLAKPLLMIGLFIPFFFPIFQIISILGIVVYAFFSTLPIFKVKDYKVIFVPFVNLIGFFLFGVFYIKGFLTSKQTF